MQRKEKEESSTVGRRGAKFEHYKFPSSMLKIHIEFVDLNGKINC